MLMLSRLLTSRKGKSPPLTAAAEGVVDTIKPDGIDRECEVFPAPLSAGRGVGGGSRHRRRQSGQARWDSDPLTEGGGGGGGRRKRTLTSSILTVSTDRRGGIRIPRPKVWHW